MMDSGKPDPHASATHSLGEGDLSVKQKDEMPGYTKFFDMPFNDVPGKKHIPRGFATVAVGIVRVIAKCLFRYEVDARQNFTDLAQKTGVVTISNHTSFLDVVFIYLSLKPPIWPRFIARESLFVGKPRILGWAFARLGVFPIKRDSADRVAIKRAARFLKDKETVVIMPEGTRRNKSNMVPTLHAGAAFIARMGHAPLLPMTVRNAENIKRKGERIRFPKVTIEFGNPILVSDFDFLPKESRLDGCIWYAMRECFALSMRCDPAEVDMKALFPEAEDFSQIFEEHPLPIHDPAEMALSLEA